MKLAAFTRAGNLFFVLVKYGGNVKKMGGNSSVRDLLCIQKGPMRRTRAERMCEVFNELIQNIFTLYASNIMKQINLGSNENQGLVNLILVCQESKGGMLANNKVDQAYTSIKTERPMHTH